MDQTQGSEDASEQPLENFSLERLNIDKKDLKALETEYTPYLKQSLIQLKYEIDQKDIIKSFSLDQIHSNLLKEINTQQYQPFTVYKTNRNIKYIENINNNIKQKVQNNLELTCKQILRKRFQDSLISKSYLRLPLNCQDFIKLYQIAQNPNVGQELEEMLENFLTATFKKKSRLVNFFSSQVIYIGESTQPVEIEQIPDKQNENLTIVICSIDYQQFIEKILKNPILSQLCKSKKDQQEVINIYLKDEYLKNNTSTEGEIKLEENLTMLSKNYASSVCNNFTNIILNYEYQQFKVAQISSVTRLKTDVNKDYSIFNNFVHPILYAQLVLVYSKVLDQLKYYCRILDQPMQIYKLAPKIIKVLK